MRQEAHSLRRPPSRRKCPVLRRDILSASALPDNGTGTLTPIVGKERIRIAFRLEIIRQFRAAETQARFLRPLRKILLRVVAVPGNGTGAAQVVGITDFCYADLSILIIQLQG